MKEGDNKKLLVVQVAALGHAFLKAQQADALLCGLPCGSVAGVFPGLTCTVQAGFRTASGPDVHGMVGNGVFDRALRRPLFWEQSSALVAGARMWEGHRRRGGTVGMFFWQQSLGETVDQVVSPAPIHKHHGGMIDVCYGRPTGLYEDLSSAVGREFSLRHYWGPMASAASSQWIAEATAQVLARGASAPGVCLTYLPALDYDLQRYGPSHPRSAGAFRSCMDQLGLLVDAARKHGYEILVFGDYAIAKCDKGAALPNRALADAGLLSLREIKGKLYPDLHTSRAFAMVDHEIAHVMVRDPGDVTETRSVLANVEGIGEVLDAGALVKQGMGHSNSGELVAIAADGWWLAYPWWSQRREAPDYAGHVDIHNKPGYDPCELFWGWPPGSVSQNVGRIKGSHGRAGAGREVAWASSFLDGDVTGLIDLARRTAAWLDGTA